jgi:thiol-disulfide isomerase/thioredoxin
MNIKKDQLLLFVVLLIPSVLFLKPVEAGNPGKTNMKVYSFEEFRPWLNRQSDSLYIVNFWATWCAPCIKEIPDFEKINELYSEKKVKVLFVSLDFPNQVESRVVPFINRMNMKAEVIVLNEPNANRWIPIVSNQWSGAIPATLIYGKNFRQFYEKEFNFEELEKIILSFIN